MRDNNDMPHQYHGIHGFGQAPPSPPTQMMPRIGGGAVIPAVSSNNNMQANTTPLYRGPIEERRLTREAMERYLKDRNNMIIVILHAKVSRK
jgi:hypothetical protein